MSAKIELLSKQADRLSGKTTVPQFNFSLPRKHDVVVPLGIPDANNHPSNPYFLFNYSINNPSIIKLSYEVFDANGELYYSLNLPAAYGTPGEYKLLWDGFDNQDIFDSRRFDHKPFKASLTACWPEGSKTLSVFFAARYHVVPWLDVIISRPEKRINVILRTHFKDGGSATADRSFKENKAARERSYEDLLRLAQEGICYHWSRNRNHPVGKNIVLTDSIAYEVFVETVNTYHHAIKTPSIVYQSNGRMRRSRNWELSRLLFYNVGKLKRAGKWLEKKPLLADADFKQTAAHEIGHEILLAYGGHIYSKTHKGSSTLLTQRPLGNYLLPSTGEIDLMLYYVTQPDHPVSSNFYKRNVASERDVKSLIWLAQIAYQLV
ncbi:hypothetical protein [Pedobacter sp.]|uniref:hypothetical protein n=1 Tax=Pedobacter sp. TaxID=1411316 RepID=UPI003D7F98EE